MTDTSCPYLGVLGPEQNHAPARDYPSFENCCFADSSPVLGTLLLADQSTYCLSGGHHQCPRYQSISLNAGAASIADPQLTDAIRSATTSIPLESDNLSQSPQTTIDDEVENYAEEDSSRSPIWLLAGSSFASVFLLGIALALYLGWQLVVNNSVIGRSNGETVNQITLEQSAQGSQDSPSPDRYIIVTATSQGEIRTESEGQLAVPQEGSSPAKNNLAVVSQPGPVGEGVAAGAQARPQEQAPQQFPVAVTPTAIVVRAGSQPGGQQSNPSAAAAQLPGGQIVQPGDVSSPDGNRIASNNPLQPIPFPPTPSPTAPSPEINVQVLVPAPPTRRSAPAVPLIPNPVVEAPTETPVPTATWLPPLVFFTTVDKVLAERKCTVLTWEVENVRAVYVQNIGVDGSGEKEVCIKDKSKSFDLTVILPDGSTEIYTTTVEIELPTVTPTVTWTFTPLPNPTPTWTPQPPTPTPVPSPTEIIVRGVRLESAQTPQNESINCTAGTTCEIGLLATNTGDAVDNLIIMADQQPEVGWNMLLCRQDGVCSSDRLVLINVGEGNTAYITIKVEGTGAASGQVGTFVFSATSEGAGESIRSQAVTLNVSLK